MVLFMLSTKYWDQEGFNFFFSFYFCEGKLFYSWTMYFTKIKLNNWREKSNFVLFQSFCALQCNAMFNGYMARNRLLENHGL